MTQSLVTVGLFVVMLACLPMAINWAKKRYGFGSLGLPGHSKIVSAVAVGPNQRVVTVEVGPESAKVWLVLGVTHQAITRLHTMSAEIPKMTAASSVTVTGLEF